MSLVQTKSFVVINGSPGMGKSATARHIGLALKATEGFDILPVFDPKDIVKYCKNGYNQIFVLDDMCGKFTADKSLIREWQRHQDTLQKLFERNPNSLRVLGTCRLQISKDNTFQRLSKRFGVTECNLLSEDLKFSTDEKREIAGKHFDTEVVQKLDDETVNQFDMFPLLCSVFAKTDDRANIGFFNNPFKLLEQEFDEICYENQGYFVGLTLLVLYNNKLNKILFQDRTNQDIDQIFDDLFELCRLTKRPVKHDVMAMLQTLNKTYVTETDSFFKAVHDKIFDMISFYFGKRIIQILLKYCDGNFFAQRVKLESLNELNEEYSIMITENNEDLYFTRLLRDIEHRKFYFFDNSHINNVIFQQKIVFCLSQHANILSIFIHNQWSFLLSEDYDCKLLLDYLIHELEVKTNASENTILEDYINLSDSDCDEHIKGTNTPLYYASTGGLLKSTRIFLNHGADINGICTYNETNATPLIGACEYGHAGIVSLLIEHNCDLNLMCNGTSPLHMSCKQEYPNIVDILLKANCDVNIQDIDEKTPLLIACETGNLNIVTMLLSSNCKVNVPNAEGKTPLHVASEQEYPSIVNTLLKANVDVNIQDDNQQTPLHLACLQGCKEIVQLLLSRCGDIDSCNEDSLIKVNCDVNIQDIDKKTPLLIACETGNLNIVTMLLSSNCNVNVPNAEGKTPLHMACEQEYPNIVDTLLKANIEVNTQDIDQQTPLHIACFQGFEEIVQLLLSRCADVDSCDGKCSIKVNCDVNIQDIDQKTPLLIACEIGNLNITTMLLSSNCDVNVPDAEGKTPLHVACFLGFEDIVELLLSKHCDLDTCDNYGNTALAVCCSRGHFFLATRLIKNHCDYKTVNFAGRSPLEIALDAGHEHIVDLLLNAEETTDIA